MYHGCVSSRCFVRAQKIDRGWIIRPALLPPHKANNDKLMLWLKDASRWIASDVAGLLKDCVPLRRAGCEPSLGCESQSSYINEHSHHLWSIKAC